MAGRRSYEPPAATLTRDKVLYSTEPGRRLSTLEEVTMSAFFSLDGEGIGDWSNIPTFEVIRTVRMGTRGHLHVKCHER